MKSKWTVIEVLQQSRHDWLNQLQLIKGNLALGKKERAEEVIEEVVAQMRQESRLTNLKLPKFALMLLTHNWEGHHFQVKYEILEQNGPLFFNDECLTAWMRSLFNELDQAYEPMNDNYLYVGIHVNDGKLRLQLHLTGIIKDIPRIKKWLTCHKDKVEQVSFQKNDETDIQVEAIFK
ncbi:Spo0B domain-containing protein [Bacillus sp. FJAT-50079]|uniref:Spo0B C-terminal domain-containing protein n=1 Tax=Bacillus sp. FJAT-50079 TaxID=2833577 RepID=UPI001BC96ABC|nr:Spo0B domain-containing protein [Bacillus sp. FJAT-50079]MBS4208971.1 Spo0B domain-containing protein [Bacillus sp. FJAT-50079]